MCVGLAIGVSFGLSSAFGEFYGPVHSVLPFLLLGTYRRLKISQSLCMYMYVNLIQETTDPDSVTLPVQKPRSNAHVYF